MTAVACVVLNRLTVAVMHPGTYGWPQTVAGICRQPMQFSCWNADDPNRAKLLAVTSADPQFAQALALAKHFLEVGVLDITNGATHYHTTTVSPAWDKVANITARIGAEIFYRPWDIETLMA